MISPFQGYWNIYAIVTDHVHEEGERHEDGDLQSHLNKDQLNLGLNVKLTKKYTLQTICYLRVGY